MELRPGRGAQRPRRANTAAEDQTLTGSGTENSARPGRRRGLSDRQKQRQLKIVTVVSLMSQSLVCR